MNRKPTKTSLGLHADWRFISICLSCLFASATCAQELQTSQIDGFSFRYPSNYRLEKVSTPAITTWPIVATWDMDGNLVIAESAGGKQSVEEQLKTKPHRIVRVIDADRDGVFDTRQVVAENLAFPEGVLCLGKDILVSAPPQIWKLSDNDGDGVCEERSVWHDGKTLTYCANDLHGPFLGPEGWIYWSKSAFAEQEFAIQNPFASKSSASHLYRKQIDAPNADRLLTGGMDNLVDVAFDPFGERFFVSTFLHHPGNGLRDGIGHAVYGATFGKDHGVLLGHPKTGPLFQPIVELGPAAPSGLLHVSKGAEWIQTTSQDSSVFVAALFNLQRVTAHEFVRQGASFTGSNRDLVVCDQLDFHPVDVLEDVDGSLLIVDTGGWYDLCCPSSGNEERIAKGGIYRLSPNKSANESPSIASIWKEIDRVSAADPSALLRHPSQRVRDIGATLLSSRLKQPKSEYAQTDEMLTAMVFDTKESIATRTTAFWTLAKRMDANPTSTPHFVSALFRNSGDPLCLAALQLSSTYRWSDRTMELVALLGSDDPSVQRLAAECLGRVGSPESLRSLLDAVEVASTGELVPRDRTLWHGLYYAMMEIAVRQDAQADSVQQLSAVLNNSQSHSKSRVYAALWVLRELNLLGAKDLDAVWLLARSEVSDLSQLACRSIEGSSALFDPWFDRLKKDRSQKSPSDTESRAIVAILASKTKDAGVKRWIADEITALGTSNDPKQESHLVQLILGALQTFRGQSLPAEWSDPIARLWNAKPLYRERLLESLSQTTLPAGAASLIACLAPMIESSDISIATKAVAVLPRESVIVPVATQRNWAKILADGDAVSKAYARKGLQRADLDREVWDLLLSRLSQLDPMEFAPIVETLASSRISLQSSNGKRLLNELTAIPAAKTLSPELLDRWFAKHPADTKTELEIAKRTIFSPPADMKQTIDRLERELPHGDAHRGQDVFRSAKAICNQCHRMGYVGGNIGPELTKIGATRNRRDLIEAIIFPSHRIAQGFASTSILTTDDSIYTGLIVAETETSIELFRHLDKRLIIDKGEIAERSMSKVSLMPEGIDKILSAQEMADLIAYLEQSK